MPRKLPRMPDFARFTDAEQHAVQRIIPRALTMFQSMGIRRSSADVEMDLSAVHARLPLRLKDLADADDFNFNHDLGGIYSKLDRSTGDLDPLFFPRFAQPEKKRKRN